MKEGGTGAIPLFKSQHFVKSGSSQLKRISLKTESTNRLMNTLIATQKTKVFIADDHAIVRQGLKQILSKTFDLEVTDEAGNGKEVLDKIEEIKTLAEANYA
jgi:PleD family two-component response regulator|tara:strand:+ start:851 stop:1156 length:306 start_codon:yes stop_codon:yes gene_type:complete